MLVGTENAGLENSGLENAGTSCAWVAKCNIINVRGHVRVNVTAYLSISRSIDGGRAFPPWKFGPAFFSPVNSTPAIWSHVFQSCVFHPRIFHGPAFSSPAFSASPCAVQLVRFQLTSRGPSATVQPLVRRLSAATNNLLLLPGPCGLRGIMRP